MSYLSHQSDSNINYVQVFAFDQLSEHAKKNAYQHFYMNSEYLSDADNIGSIEAFLDAFGLSLASYEYDAYRFDYRYRINNEVFWGDLHYASENGQETPLSPSLDALAAIFPKRYLKNGAEFLIDEEFMLSGYYLDYALLDIVDNIFLGKQPLPNSWEELINCCVDAAFAEAVKDVEYVFSYEYFLDAVADQEYKYFEDGQLVDSTITIFSK